MKTDDLIGLLSNQVVRIERGVVARTTVFWAKMAYPLAIAVGAMLAVTRLGRPGARAGYSWALIALPFVAVWAASMVLLDGTAPGARWAVVLGHTWRTCPFNIMLLSLPTFPAVFWAVKVLAPTQLRLAGAVAGLLASSTATVVYCLHCPEMSPAFWGVWYAIGMLVPAGVGAWLGPKLLRW